MPSITEELISKVSTAVEKHKGADDISWDAGLVLIPGPEGQPFPAHMYVIITPNPILGVAALTDGGVLADAQNATYDFVEEKVLASLRNLREARSRVIEMSSAQVPEEPSGQHAPPSGLIIL